MIGSCGRCRAAQPTNWEEDDNWIWWSEGLCEDCWEELGLEVPYDGGVPVWSPATQWAIERDAEIEQGL